VSKTAVLTWELPTTREEGGPLDIAEILHTQVDFSLDGGVNYVEVDKILPAAAQTINAGDLQYGTYFFRFVVADTGGLFSAPLDFPIDIPDDSAPGQVVNVQVTLS
jgi:hypothetical protein